MTHICVGNLTIIGSGNGLSPYRRQAIIWTNAEILLIGRVGTNFSELSIEILTFSFKKMRLKASPATWRPFCFGLNVLTGYYLVWYCIWAILMNIFMLIRDIISARWTPYRLANHYAFCVITTHFECQIRHYASLSKMWENYAFYEISAPSAQYRVLYSNYHG